MKTYVLLSPQAVVAANARQKSGDFHPLTCPNRGDGKHHITTDLGVLVCTRTAWVCIDCNYKQRHRDC